MPPDAPSPFLIIAEAEWLRANALAFAVFDSFPVSLGHVLVITRRLVPTWFDCTPAEQQALMELINEVKKLLDERLDPKPDGYNVGFNAGEAAGQTVPHVHIHVIPRYSGDMADPRGGVRHVIPEKGNYLARSYPGDFDPRPGVDRQSVDAARQIANLPPQGCPQLSLTTGPDCPLWPRLAERLPGAAEIDLLASFVQLSGLDHVREALFSALGSGARVRLLVGDYLGITDPAALEQLLGWMDLAGAAFQARLAELAHLKAGAGRPVSFHPKAWRIADSAGGMIVVGSSNLSKAALVTGVEWNLVGETSGGDIIDQELAAAFDGLWSQGTSLSPEVIARYAAKAAAARELRRAWEDAGEGAEAAAGVASGLRPRPWQASALESLASIRGQGYSKALVAVATGLGKTWLAAFDVVQVAQTLGRLPRVLVIAHRAEILAQAEAALRAALTAAASEHGWPMPRVSWFVGDGSDLSGSLVIASIQKLFRPAGLESLDAADPFDYCVIDEVHHAEAPTYRRVLARLRSSFTLGLTATPARSDGVDVATLFDDILAYQATIGDGIAEQSLVPFRYRGLKDDVDFTQVNWRNGRFDQSELELALENSARMERLWKEWQAEPATRTLVFCCSRRHAVFARNWLRDRGVRAAAVFSGTGGDPRMQSRADFAEGRLQALCVVDLFNEGVDIPLVDRVVMLRPTESKIVFLQQLGRGLRAAEGKTRLEVIDFVGNHRVFAGRLMHLLSLVPRGDVPVQNFAALKSFLEGNAPTLPPGCLVDVEIEAKQLLKQFLPAGRAAVIEAYRSMRADLGRRPTASEVFHAGYLPMSVSGEYGSWFEFCQSEGDLASAEESAVGAFAGWFKMLQTTNLNKSYKMIVLRVLLDHDAFWGGMPVERLAERCREFLENHPALRADLEGAAFERNPSDPSAEAASFAQWWLEWPLSRWMDEQAGHRWFTTNGESFTAAFTCPAESLAAFESLTGELVDYRLAHYTRSRLGAAPAGETGSAAERSTSFRAKVSHSSGKPILFVPSVETEPGRPMGPTPVRLPDGSEWMFRFVKVACNVAHRADGSNKQNELPALLREWFGPDAGLPGTNFEVEFRREGDAWHARPHESLGRKPGNSGPAPHPAPLLPTTTAATDSFPLPLLVLPAPYVPLHHPRPRLRPHRRGRLLGPGERAGGDRLDGGAGRVGEARHVRGAGDGHVDGATDPGRLMVPVPSVSGGFARGPDRARAVRVARRGRERRPVHRQEVPLGEDGHRRRLAARPHSAPTGESGVRADHARVGGFKRTHDNREVRRGRALTAEIKGPASAIRHE
jgi:superfamily II DNA or RNA helicase/diadenosine tetraphosphate (Ap4A) HIT family hydrolase/HKD family nuclease